jgi:hypothetical protein
MGAYEHDGSWRLFDTRKPHAKSMSSKFVESCFFLAQSPYKFGQIHKQDLRSLQIILPIIGSQNLQGVLHD